MTYYVVIVNTHDPIISLRYQTVLIAARSLHEAAVYARTDHGIVHTDIVSIVAVS